MTPSLPSNYYPFSIPLIMEFTFSLYGVCASTVASVEPSNSDQKDGRRRNRLRIQREFMVHPLVTSFQFKTNVSVLHMGVWKGVYMYSLKFHTDPPCPTLLCSALRVFYAFDTSRRTPMLWSSKITWATPQSPEIDGASVLP
jgi:hypothetical protein